MTQEIAITRLTENELLSRVLYRDALILVLNKPSGIAVHKAGPCKHNLEQYFHHLCFGLPKHPVLAHRLDFGTSGCLVLARNAHAARTLQELFTAGKIKKTYVALVEGIISTDSGRIDVPLMKQSPEKSNWRMKASLDGNLPAITDYEVIERKEHTTLLKLTPHTGRTHQLRVHCQALGYPIVGDTIYGDKKAVDKKLHLHAESIEIPLYKNKPVVKVMAPRPEWGEGAGTLV